MNGRNHEIQGHSIKQSIVQIFDNCMISNQYDSLFTNDLQFAYKSKTTTTHCVSSIFETANHYVAVQAQHMYAW